MARQKRVFSPEFREDAVKLVIDTSQPIAQVARESARAPWGTGWPPTGGSTPERSPR